MGRSRRDVIPGLLPNSSQGSQQLTRRPLALVGTGTDVRAHHSVGWGCTQTLLEFAQEIGATLYLSPRLSRILVTRE